MEMGIVTRMPLRRDLASIIVHCLHASPLFSRIRAAGTNSFCLPTASVVAGGLVLFIVFGSQMDQ